jgi:hypothetical protein
MLRGIRFAVIGLTLLGLLSFLPLGSLPLSLSAASSSSLGLHRPSIGWSGAMAQARRGMPVLDRLLRRPGAAFGGGAVTPPSGFGLRFDGVDDRVTFGNTLATGTSAFTLEVWFMREGLGKTASPFHS